MTTHNITNVDKSIFETLKVVQQYAFKDAIIAGGAIRDIYLNRQFNDVDIYIQDPTIAHRGHYPFLTDRIWWKTFWSDVFSSTLLPSHTSRNQHVSVNQMFGKGYYGNAHVTAVWQIEKDLQPYQVIFVDQPPETYVAKYFDFGLCMAYSDGVRLRYLPEFRRDVKNKTMTLIGNDIDEHHLNRVMSQHFKKMQRYFPEYSLTVAPHNQTVYTNWKNNRR